MNYLKGQSAIEYLTTYGWMLIAAGVAASFLFQNVGEPCVDTSTGFLGRDAQITNYGITEAGNFTMAVSNNNGAAINITGIVVEKNGVELLKDMNNTRVDAYSEQVVNTADGLDSGTKCTEFNITIYHTFGGLENQKSTGIIRTRSGIGEKPLSPENISVQ